MAGTEMHDTKAPATRIRMVRNAKWIEKPADDAPEDPVPEMKTPRKVEDIGGKGDPYTASRSPTVPGSS